MQQKDHLTNLARFRPLFGNYSSFGKANLIEPYNGFCGFKFHEHNSLLYNMKKNDWNCQMCSFESGFHIPLYHIVFHFELSASGSRLLYNCRASSSSLLKLLLKKNRCDYGFVFENLRSRRLKQKSFVVLSIYEKHLGYPRNLFCAIL